MGCFTTLLFAAAAVMVLVSVLRWFEQVTEAVELRWWNKVFVLVAMPLTVWLFPSKVSAGRPTDVPRHEPVRGFGGLPKGGIAPPGETPAADAAGAAGMAPASSDQPPPGTPKEFLGMPKIPPRKPKGTKPAVDPDKIAKLRQKMREQGMLGGGDDDE
jgi:hypothetical protein